MLPRNAVLLCGVTKCSLPLWRSDKTTPLVFPGQKQIKHTRLMKTFLTHLIDLYQFHEAKQHLDAGHVQE